MSKRRFYQSERRGKDSGEDAIRLISEQFLKFSCGGFVLRNASRCPNLISTADRYSTAPWTTPETVGGEATVIYSEKWPADEQKLPIGYMGNDAIKTATTVYKGVTAFVTYIMVDTDNDGKADKTVAVTDTDNDGVYQDDADGDGQFDDNTYFGVDKDNDGIIDVYVQVTDEDGDGVYTDAYGNRYAVSKKFVDVADGTYYTDAVEWAQAKGITYGTTPCTFSPQELSTRAQVVTFLWRAAGCPEPKGDASVFTDVPADSYYEKAVAWAIENGIAKGTSKTTFSPNLVCTRAHCITFLARFAGIEDTDTESGFSDVKTSDYYAAAVKWAKDNNIAKGTSATTFSPNRDCTRAQIVTFLYRYFVK